MKRALLLSALLPAIAASAPPDHFGVTAVFVAPAKAGANGAVAVSFLPKDADVRINEEPAPRLKLDAGQNVLVDKQERSGSVPPPSFDPATARYLDTKLPVRFPVGFGPQAAKGTHSVKAAVTYFYCSKREGWCRKGTTDVEFAVTVP
jgi:hypothetical protein